MKKSVALAAIPLLVLPLIARADFPTPYFAPYVDMASYPTPNVAAIASASGTLDYTLAFVTATSSNAPAWGGYSVYTIGTGGGLDATINSNLASLRAMGGDVSISFGGQAGTDLADVITNVSTLQSDYQTVLNTYNVHRVDFDIEGTDPANHAAVDRRMTAIAALQQAAPAASPLNVGVTLQVEPTGLDANGLYVVQSAITHGVSLSTVNLMAMDYGDSNAPNPSGHMGDYAIQSTTSTFNQLVSTYGSSKTNAQVWALLGITPMIGQNDTPSETFSLADAQNVEAWAAQHHISSLSFWLATRDHSGATDEFHSGITQSDYAFAHAFQPYAPALLGDANNDNKVDLNDLNIVLNHLGMATTLRTNGNFDAAPAIDLNDLNAVLNHLGVTATSSAVAAESLGPVAAPEPASMTVLISALPLLHRRRNSKLTR